MPHTAAPSSLHVSLNHSRGGLHRRQLLAAGAAAGLATLAGCSKNDVPAPAAAGTSSSGTAPAGSSREAYETAARGTGFLVGQPMSARVLKVFFDPQCPHCGKLWVAAKPLRDRIRMVWMPVAFIAPSSGPQGAMLLAADNATALMDQHESLLAAGRGGISAMGADDKLLAKIKANTEIWRSLQATSVPHLVYRAGADGPYGSVSGGLPTEELARTLGL